MSALVLICATLVMSDGDSGRCRTADGETHRDPYRREERGARQQGRGIWQ